jgi:hypothetical protein
VIDEGLSEIVGPFPVPPPKEIRENETTIRDRREEATDIQDIHPTTRFPSIVVIGGQSMILTALTGADPASSVVSCPFSFKSADSAKVRGSAP